MHPEDMPLEDRLRVAAAASRFLNASPFGIVRTLPSLPLSSDLYATRK
jgi:hypothetical protein